MEVSFGKIPSAVVPVKMSLGALCLALAVLVFRVATHGARLEVAEDVVDHLYQLLVIAQLPVIAFFLYRWLRRAPTRALTVVVVQALALATALVPVHMMGW